MITPLDDYPVHQTAQPLIVPATSDRNFYDRFWFNGFVGDGSLYFSVATGFYPNRHVMDGGISVLVDGQQHCLHIAGGPAAGSHPNAAGAAQGRDRGADAPPSCVRQRP